jgi:hypothetical protein
MQLFQMHLLLRIEMKIDKVDECHPDCSGGSPQFFSGEYWDASLSMTLTRRIMMHISAA